METTEKITKLSYPCKIADQEDVLIKWGIENHDEWVITPVGIYGRYKYEDIKKDPWSRPMRDWCFEKEPKKIYTPMNAIPIVVARYTADIPSPTRWDTSVNGDVLWLWGIPSNEVSTRKYKQ